MVCDSWFAPFETPLSPVSKETRCSAIGPWSNHALAHVDLEAHRLRRRSAAIRGPTIVESELLISAPARCEEPDRSRSRAQAPRVRHVDRPAEAPQGAGPGEIERPVVSRRAIGAQDDKDALPGLDLDCPP